MSLLILPNEILVAITKYLKPHELLSLILVNKFLSLLLLPTFHKISLANHNGTPVLFWAVKKGYIGLLRLAIQLGADINAVRHHHTPLLYAIAKGKLAAVQLLLDSGADTEIPDGSGYTPLVIAVGWAKLPYIAWMLLRAGAKVNLADASSTHPSGSTPPLHLELGIRNVEPNLTTLKLLLDKGANVNDLDTEGRTPLVRMLDCHHSWSVVIPAVKMLLRAGADPNVIRDGAPLLHSLLGNRYVLQALVDAGVDLDMRNEKNGQTALCKAAINGFTTAIEILLEAGADTELTDDDGVTPLRHAKARGFHSVVKQFRDFWDRVFE